VALRSGQVARGEKLVYRGESVTFVRGAGTHALVEGDVVGGSKQVPWSELRKPDEFMVEQHPHEQF
jgi:hypothetical protein